MNDFDISDVTSESSVIGTLIAHPEYIYYNEQLSSNHFTNSENAKYFAAVSHLAHQEIPNLDMMNIQMTMEKLGIENIPSDSEMRDFLFMSQYVARSSPEEYMMVANNVLEKAFRRTLLSKLRACERLCDSKEADIQNKVYDVLDNVMMEYCNTNDVPQYKDVVDGLWAKIKERQQSEKSGFDFKFPTLNEYVTIERGELVLFGAQEKVGKSIMLLNCAVDLLEKGASVLYIDSELSSEQFTLRLAAHLTGIEYKRIKYGRYTPEEEARIEAAIAHTKTWKLTHKNLPIFDSKTIYTVAKKVKHTQDIDVLIVDYFKMNKEDADAFETYMSGGALIDMVKNRLASDLEIAALGAVQLTRSGSVADSAKIARNCSSLILLRPKTDDELDDDGGKEFGTHALTVSRNRNGEQMRNDEYISLTFDGNRIMFEEPAKQPVRESPV